MPGRLVAFVVAMALAAGAWGSDVCLVKGAQPQVVIATGAEPSETIALAAHEIQTYVRKMSGATLEVADEATGGAAAILLGEEAVRQGAPGVDLSGLGPEGALLRTLPSGSLVVSGRTDMGTLNAAYDLLDLLGVRWFMPGAAGEHVPKMGTVTVPESDRAFEPSFAHRNIRAAVSRLPKQQREEYEAWQRRNRMPGAMNGTMGHAYDKIVSRRDKQLFAQHPEHFAEVAGKRTDKGQICTTDAEVIRRAVEYARAHLENHPEQMMVSLSPNDGGGFCRCERCRAEGSSSDNALMLANRVAEAIERDFPDKFVAFYAYGGTSPPPNIEGRQNVIVWIATAFIQGPYTPEQLVEGWSAKVAHIGIRTYYSVNAWSWQMPRYDPEAIAESLQYYHRSEAVGVNAEAEDNFGSRGVNYYVAARLMYDVDQPLDELLTDYYGKCWGSAAPAMREYWERWRDNPTVSCGRLHLALQDLARADALAQTQQVRDRIAMQKTYLHYMQEFRKYAQAGEDTQFSALGDFITYGFRIQPFHMVMAPNVFERIVGKRNARNIDAPEDMIASWREVRPITYQQIESDFARDLVAIEPLGVERKLFSDRLMPVRATVSGAASAPAYRRVNECLVLTPPDGKLRIGVTAGLVRSRELLLVLETLDGEELDRREVPPGATRKLIPPTGGTEYGPMVLSTGQPGLFRLRVEPQGGSACRLDFGALRQVVKASEKTPVSLVGGSKGPLYFYVPRGTTAFAVGLRTQDQGGQLTVMNPAGEVALQEAGNYLLGEEFRVPVPEGEDEAVWSLRITRCEDCILYLVGVPGYVSQKPEALLAPREALVP